jgi:hypothetical protein
MPKSAAVIGHPAFMLRRSFTRSSSV